jgi:hypothetical protein
MKEVLNARQLRADIATADLSGRIESRRVIGAQNEKVARYIE